MLILAHILAWILIALVAIVAIGFLLRCLLGIQKNRPIARIQQMSVEDYERVLAETPPFARDAKPPYVDELLTRQDRPRRQREARRRGR